MGVRFPPFAPTTSPSAASRQRPLSEYTLTSAFPSTRTCRGSTRRKPMKSSARIAVVLILFAASASHAQQVLVGQMNPRSEVFFTSSVAGTLIDTNNPANATGVLNTATVQWMTNVSPCATTFRIRFYRQPTAGNLTMVAERGPFTATTGAAMSIPLTPPVSVNAGDLIGVAMFGDVNCGVASAQSLANQTFLAI